MAGWNNITPTSNNDAYIDGLLGTTMWNSTTLTYNFPQTASYYPATYFTNGSVPANYTFDIAGTFVPASTGTPGAPGITNVYDKLFNSSILTDYEAVSNLNFSPVANNAAANTVDVSIGRAVLPNDEQTGTITGHAYRPGGVQRSGDTWYSTNSYYGGNPANGDFFVNGLLPGGPGWFVILHEMGHSVGLKHAHESGTVVPADRDSFEFTVMTYRDYVGAPAERGSTAERYGRPQTIMMLDIQAIQYLYGADFTTHAGNSNYTFSTTTGEMLIDGVGQGVPGANRVFRTIWDGSGFDTYDLSNYTTNLVVNLAPGGWSVFSDAQRAVLDTDTNVLASGNVYNALQYQGDARSLIEAAIGGTGNDNMTGNSAANSLVGNAGNDTLNGGLGSDTLFGGDGNDIIFATHADGDDTISGGSGFDILDFSGVNGVVQINQLAGTITGSAGNDTLLDVIEQIKGTNFNDVLSGGHGINVLDGEGGHDQFFGNNGDDLMRGGTGDDTFFFSTSDGNDTLLGGDGFDILDYSSLLGVVQVNQLAGTTTGTANNDTLSDVFEQVIGTAFGDVLSGGHGINSLKGNGGDDQLFANNGDDYTSGGDGNDTITMGVGNDTHDFRNGEDVDTILDFTAGGTEDTITLTFYSGLGSTSFDAAFQARLSTVSGHAELLLNGGDRIIFNNVASHTSLTAADFIF